MPLSARGAVPVASMKASWMIITDNCNIPWSRVPHNRDFYTAMCQILRSIAWKRNEPDPSDFIQDCTACILKYGYARPDEPVTLREFKAMTRRTGYRVIRNRSRKKRPSHDTDLVESSPDMPREDALDHEQFRRVRRAIDSLPDVERLVMLRYLDNPNISAISSSYGLTYDAVRGALGRAKAQLKQLLNNGDFDEL